MEEKLQVLFKFSKVKENTFKYCGCKTTEQDDEIELDQDKYIEKLKNRKRNLIKQRKLRGKI